MAVFGCLILNTSPSFVKVTISSPFGQTALFVPPSGSTTVPLQTGTKAIATFDLGNNLVALFPVFIGSSVVIDAFGSGAGVPPPVALAAPAAPVPFAGGPAF
jgi:hypothetical protein